ncbi:UNVERIFIED_CONTAM: hypothetical protein Sangu_0436600 [Sesamum angustifolium]|uniref:Uncharacterized protein n=1 Tax=Sesamum angustifolium TaxID=2727405 RepID=A0AAW2QU22_9LAMI
MHSKGTGAWMLIDIHTGKPIGVSLGCSWHAILILSLGGVISVASTGDLGLRLFWHIIHLFVSDWYFVAGLMKTLESFLISSGLSIGLRNVCLCDKEGVLKISQEALNYG